MNPYAGENLRLDLESELTRVTTLLSAAARHRDLLHSSALIRERDRLKRHLKSLQSTDDDKGGDHM